MATPKLLIHAVKRSLGEQQEQLTFEPGVNLIVGPRNSGKSKWLQSIDQLFGDDIEASERNTDDILVKYDSAALSFSIGEEPFTVERHWKEPGVASKLSVNGQTFGLKEYRELLMQRLGIPIIHYPKGDPYGRRAWPELGWRSLFRHIYRRQRFWNDIADQQPEGEQHACLVQFLGIAAELFSEEYNTLVEQEKTLASMEEERDQFLKILSQVTREVVNTADLGVAVTPDSVEEALLRLGNEQVRIQVQREEMLREVQQQAAPGGKDAAVSELSQALVSLRAERDDTAAALQRTRSRIKELQDYSTLLEDELSRMRRALDAGNILTELKVTHCPACDQAVNSDTRNFEECYLCKQHISGSDGEFRAAGKRVEFEVEQLQAELAETGELLSVLEQEVRKHEAHEIALEERQADVEASLQPIRSAAIAILPPALPLLDMESGRVHEQVKQLERVRISLKRRQALAQRIESLQKSIAAKERSVEEQRRRIDFYRLGNLMSQGVNFYLKSIDKLKPGAYNQKAAQFTIWDRGFQITVGEGRWNRKLGATLSLYFLLAYHYALLRLTPRAECHYPGLSIIDFPAELPEKIVDQENFLVEPFIRMLNHKEMGGAQVIIAGAGFEGLGGVHRIPLTTVWK